MRMRLLGVALTGLVAAGLSTLVGCGSDCGNGTVDNGDGQCVAEGVTCGDGTVLANLQCTPDISRCGTGTKLEGGVCIPDAAAANCGTGTSYDTATGTCVANSSITCGENTTQEGNVCVGTGGTTQCGAGTVLDNGACVPDGSGCAEGTVPSNGQCVAGTYMQFANNIPEAAGATVDVYVDSTLVADDLAFRSATAFLAVAVDGTATVSVTAGDATDNTSPLVQTSIAANAGDSLVVVALSDGSGTYRIAPVVSRRFATGAQLQLALLNGTPDIGNIRLEAYGYDVLATTSNPSGQSLAYGESTASPVTLVGVTPAFDLTINSSSDTLGAYQISNGYASTGDIPLTTAASNDVGLVAMLLTSGLDASSDVGLYAVSRSGGAFLALDEPARAQFAQLDNGGRRDVYTEGVFIAGQFPYANATSFIPVVAGGPVVVDFYDDDTNVSTRGQTPSAGDVALGTTTYTFTGGQNYFVALTSGAVTVADFSARLATTNGSFDLAFFNAESVAVDVNVTVDTNPAVTLADNIGSLASEDYTTFSASGTAVVSVTDGGTTNAENQFTFGLPGFNTRTAVLVTTGTRGSSSEGLLVVLSDGGVYQYAPN